MPTDPKFAARQQAASRLAAAYASASAGEPGFEAKVAEARQVFDAEFGEATDDQNQPDKNPNAPPIPPQKNGEPDKDTDAAVHPDAGQDLNLLNELLDKNKDGGKGPNMCKPSNTPGYDAGYQAGIAAASGQTYSADDSDGFDAGFRAGFEAARTGNFDSNPSETTVLPEQSELSLSDTNANDSGHDPEIQTGKGGTFAAELSIIRGQLQTVADENAGLRNDNAKLNKAVAALLGRNVRNEFQSFLDKKKSEGHQFDAPTAMSAFENSDGNIKVIQAIKSLIEKAPKVPSLADAGRTFSADDAAKNLQKEIGGTADDTALIRKLQEVTGLKFTAQDLAVGKVMNF